MSLRICKVCEGSSLVSLSRDGDEIGHEWRAALALTHRGEQGAAQSVLGQWTNGEVALPRSLVDDPIGQNGDSAMTGDQQQNDRRQLDLAYGGGSHPRWAQEQRKTEGLFQPLDLVG